MDTNFDNIIKDHADHVFEVMASRVAAEDLDNFALALDDNKPHFCHRWRR